MELIELLHAQNPWWISNEVPFQGTFKRFLLEELVPALAKKKILLITGPRRSGKSTVMFQLIQEQITAGIQPRQLLYFSFDHPQMLNSKSILDDILSAYSELTKMNPEQDQIYLFLDEVQKVANWEESIKQWHDRRKNIVFIVSGSSSLKLLKRSGEALVGRVKPFFLFPMGFREFYYAKTQKKISIVSPQELGTYGKQLLISKHEILPLFREWLVKGGYPEVTFLEDPKEIRETLSLYALLTLQRDIADIYHIREVKTLEKLLYLLADLTTQRINYAKLASIVETKVDTLKRYLSFLEETFLITLSYIYAEKQYFSLRKERKVFFIDSGLRNSLQLLPITEGDFPKLVEQAVAIQTMKHNFSFQRQICLYWMSKEGHEVDAVALGEHPTPIEVKYRDKIIEKDLKGIITMMQEYKLPEGIIITRDHFGELQPTSQKLKLIPAWLFLITQK